MQQQSRSKAVLAKAPKLLLYAYLFFLSIDFMGSGMKASFKDSLRSFLDVHAGDFNELVSFVIGVIGTSLVQSSSTVTAMAVVLTQEGIVPLLIAIGIVHGANLGTSVTSSLVAFAAEAPPLTGNPLRDAWNMLFGKRRPGFHRAVSTAVVHGLFNAVMVTGILLAFELPFGLIHHVAEASSELMAGLIGASGPTVLAVLDWVSPSSYTKPVAKGLLGLGAPGWALVIAGFAALFASLKGFSKHMKALVLSGTEPGDVDAIGRTFLGASPVDTFVRGLVFTVMVQSSTATTSMVVPLAAMGFFSLRQVFPFIMGANIGTTATALLAAAGGVGGAGFEAGMTIALAHFYLNVAAVALVAAIPPLRTSILGATEWLADTAVKVPAVLVGYLAVLSLVVPLVVYFAPYAVSVALLSGIVLFMLVGPHVYLRRKAARLAAAPPPTDEDSSREDTAALVA